MTNKQVSNQAQVAKLCKQYCTSLGVKVSAKSESFSMGDAVRVNMQDVSPELYETIKDELNKYQYGHYDGMNDIYEYSNRNHDIPQTKFMDVSNSFSDEMAQTAYTWLKGQSINLDNKPEDYQEAKTLSFCNDISGFTPFDEIIEREVLSILRGNGRNIYSPEDKAHYKLSDLFWKSLEAKPAKQSSQDTAISKHTHTKKGFDMWIIELSGRVSREEYLTLLDQARSMGGWYSRKWGNTPAGFAFKDEITAHRFSKGLSTAEPGKKAPMQNSDKLRTMADNLQKQIDDKLSDRPTHTARMMKHAEAAKMEGARLQRTQKAMQSMADLIDSEQLPEVLNDITTKKAIYDLMASKKELIENGFHTYYVETGEPLSDTAKAKAIWALLDNKKPSKEGIELQRLENQVKLSNIDGYYPTPDDVIDKMLDNVKESDRVLEPSAGNGAIVGRLKGITESVDCFERNQTLSKILELKGHKIIGDDFLEANLDFKYDAIIMNPPFENQQDIDHVLKAYTHLKDDGHLVAIMSPGFTFRENKKSVAFREWLDHVGGTWEELPEKSFKQAGTNVNTVLVNI